MQPKNYAEIGKELGLKFSASRDISDGPTPVGKNPGEHYLFLDGYSRTTGKDIKTVWDEFEHSGLNWYEFKRFQDTLTQYKESRNLYDYTDMLLN